MIAAISGSHGFLGKYLESFLEQKHIEVLRIPRDKFENPMLLHNFFALNPVDYIFHLAAYGNMHSQKNDDQTFFANLWGTYNMLRGSQQIPYKAFINISTSSVLLDHETMYSATKAGAERLCKAFVDTYNKPIVTLRPATIIGKGEQEEHLIPTLIRSGRKNKTMPFVPLASHDFIDVRDVIEAIWLCANNIGIVKGQSINVGTNIATTNQRVKHIVESVLGKEIQTRKVKSLRSYDQLEWKVDNKELIALGWRPKHSLEETIKWMIEDEKN